MSVKLAKGRQFKGSLCIAKAGSSHSRANNEQRLCKHRWEIREKGRQRNAGCYALDVPGFSGKAVHAYIGFLSDDAKFVTTNVFAGTMNFQ